MTVSLAAGLAAMAARCSDELPDRDRLVSDAERLRQRASELVDADARAYQTVLETYAATRSDAVTERRDRVRTALEAAAAVPLEMAVLGARTAVLAASLARTGKVAVRGDARTACILAEAAVRSAAHLVDLDVAAGDGDEELVRRAAHHCEIAAVAHRDLTDGPDAPVSGE